MSLVPLVNKSVLTLQKCLCEGYGLLDLQIWWIFFFFILLSRVYYFRGATNFSWSFPCVDNNNKDYSGFKTAIWQIRNGEVHKRNRYQWRQCKKINNWGRNLETFQVNCFGCLTMIQYECMLLMPCIIWYLG